MSDTTFGIILILVGCILLIFRRWFVHGSIDFQDRVYGFHFGGERVIKIYYLFVLVMGLFLIVYGMLVLFGISI